MVCFCVCVRGLGGFNVFVCCVCEALCCCMVCFVRGVCACVVCLRVLRVVYCVMLYGLFFFFFFCVCVGVLLICLCGVFMNYSALSYGLCLRCCVFVRVGLNVLVRFVCDLVSDVV